MKAIKQAELNDILNEYFREEISASRVTEKVNELAETFAKEFLSWTNTYKDFGIKTNDELLEIFKTRMK